MTLATAFSEVSMTRLRQKHVRPPILELEFTDKRSHVLSPRIKNSGLTDKPIETLIDHIEFDEGRDPVADLAWEKI